MPNVQRSFFVQAPPSTVWSLLAKYDEAPWHPLVTNVDVLTKGTWGMGSERACSFEGGLSQKERVVAWRENEAFSIEIYDIAGPIKSARSDWTLRAERSGTRVTVNVSYEPVQGAPAKEVEAALVEHVRIATDGIARTAEARRSVEA